MGVKPNFFAQQYMGTAEVASLVGLSRQRISELRRRGGMPPPFQVLKLGPVWLTSDIALWATERKPDRRRAMRKTVGVPGAALLLFAKCEKCGRTIKRQVRQESPLNERPLSELSKLFLGKVEAECPHHPVQDHERGQDWLPADP